MLDPLFLVCGWNVNLLAASLGVGHRTFTRLTEESIGITAKVWLRQIRIVRSQHLLREGHKIERVSCMLGFRHKADFTHEFHKLVGVCPSTFARSEQRRLFDPHTEG